MLCNLTFKKAFGLETLPADYAFWLAELWGESYRFAVNNTLVDVKAGKFGISEQEKFVISLFLHSDERDLNFICEILTLDIGFSVDLSVPEHQQGENLAGKIDNLIEPFIAVAFRASTRFVDAYRTAKYEQMRRSEEWKSGMVSLVPEMTEAEFRSYLFYSLKGLERTFVGHFSAGQMRTSSSVDTTIIAQNVHGIVENEVPLNSKLIVLAWEYLFREDYRNSIIYSATVLELTIIKVIRRIYASNNAATTSQVDKFLDNTSNRLLCTVVLGSLGIGDEALRNSIASVFDIRNGLVHGKKKKASKDEAESVISDTEKFLEFLEKS